MDFSSCHGVVKMESVSSRADLGWVAELEFEVVEPPTHLGIRKKNDMQAKKVRLFLFLSLDIFGYIPFNIFKIVLCLYPILELLVLE